MQDRETAADSRKSLTGISEFDRDCKLSDELCDAKVANVKIEAELEQLRYGLAYQLGVIILDLVKQMRCPPWRWLRVRTAILNLLSCRYCIGIDAALFANLPTRRPHLPKGDDAAALMAARNLYNSVRLFRSDAVGRDHGAVKAELPQWLSVRVRRALELDKIARDGFPLPQRDANVRLFDRARAQRRCPQRGRLLFLLRHDPATVSNGYSTRTRHLAHELSALGYRVDALIAPAQASQRTRLSVDGITYHGLPITTAYVDGVEAYVRAYADAVETFARQTGPCVIHAASDYVNGLAAVLAARRLSMPCVYEVRGLWELTHATNNPGFDASLGFAAIQRLETEAALAADRVVALGGVLKETLVARGIPHDQIVIAPSGAPKPQGDGLTVTALADLRRRITPTRRLNTVERRMMIGFAGTITPYEGLDVLVAAFSRAARARKDVDLVIIGDGPGEAGLLRTVAGSDVRDRIHLVGRLPPADAAAAYRLFDLAVFPRLSTPVTEVVSPLKHMEAAAAGCPIIVSDVAPLRAFAEATHAALCVKAGDVDALAAAMVALLETCEARTQLARRGQTVAARQTWAATAKIISDTYDELL